MPFGRYRLWRAATLMNRALDPPRERRLPTMLPRYPRPTGLQSANRRFVKIDAVTCRETSLCPRLGDLSRLEGGHREVFVFQPVLVSDGWWLQVGMILDGTRLDSMVVGGPAYNSGPIHSETRKANF